MRLVEILELLGAMLAFAAIIICPIALLGMALDTVDHKYDESEYTCAKCKHTHYFVREINGERCCLSCGAKIEVSE